MTCTTVAPDGIYHGACCGDVARYTAIRYADCSRFEPPVPHSDAGKDVDATQPSPLCAQNPNHVEAFILKGNPLTLPMQEDALFLNVMVPNAPQPAENLPVMVWIHGGAFKSGGASSPLYDQGRLCGEGGVIVVAINYRLGFSGFVRDEEGNLANLGFLDIMEALRWVSRNIAAFGGNPENITIFGQSAGASAVQYLLATEAAGTLFNRAIIQSSCFGALEGREAMDAFQLDLANQLAPDASLEELLEKEAYAMANNPEKGNGKYCAFAPHPGVFPLPAQGELQEAWDQAARKGIELMVGCGRREASLYALANPKLATLSKIPLVKNIVEAVVAGKSRAIFSQGAQEFARRWAQAGGKGYQYDLFWGVGESLVGGCHCSELPLLLEQDGPYVSPLYMGKPDEEIARTARRLRAVWAEFATDGCVSDLHIPGCMDIEAL